MDVLNEHWGMSLARPNGCSAVQDVLPHLNALLSDRILSQPSVNCCDYMTGCWFGTFFIFPYIGNSNHN